jgi:hypothetical protein
MSAWRFAVEDADDRVGVVEVADDVPMVDVADRPVGVVVATVLAAVTDEGEGAVAADIPLPPAMTAVGPAMVNVMG